MDINGTGKKKCMYCAEEISADALYCPFCGSLLDVAVDKGDSGNESPAPETIDQSQENNEDINVIAQNSCTDETAGETAGNRNMTDFNNTPDYNNEPMQNFQVNARSMSNGMKVFLTVLFTVIPGFGQLAGIITAIVFMNSENDPDKRSFGVALLVASLVMFVLSCILSFIFVIAFSVKASYY